MHRDDRGGYPASAAGHLPLPAALFVLGYDESGRARCHQSRLDTVVMAGLLAELVIEGALRIVNGRPTRIGDTERPRELTRWALGLIGAAGPHELTDWIQRIGPEATAGTYAELERNGKCVRESNRRLGVFKVSRIRFTDPTVLARSEAWFNNTLAWATRPDRTDATLATLARELGDMPPAYTDLSGDERRARLTLITASMDEPLRRITAAAHNAIAATALGAYR